MNKGGATSVAPTWPGYAPDCSGTRLGGLWYALGAGTDPSERRLEKQWPKRMLAKSLGGSSKLAVLHRLVLCNSM